MSNIESTESTHKVSDSAYSHSCSNSQSQRRCAIEIMVQYLTSHLIILVVAQSHGTVAAFRPAAVATVGSHRFHQIGKIILRKFYLPQANFNHCNI